MLVCVGVLNATSHPNGASVYKTDEQWLGGSSNACLGVI